MNWDFRMFQVFNANIWFQIPGRRSVLSHSQLFSYQIMTHNQKCFVNIWLLFITSGKQIMLLGQFVCLFVCLSSLLLQN